MFLYPGQKQKSAISTNHPHQKWFAIQKLLQPEGTVSAWALKQKRSLKHVLEEQWWGHGAGGRVERRRAWDDRMLLVYLFPIAAVTVWHKCGSFKQHQFIILQSWRLESKTDLTGLILRCQQGCIPSGGSRGKSLCFTASKAACFPWCVVAFLQLESH